jgi:hypothetical protein
MMPIVGSMGAPMIMKGMARNPTATIASTIKSGASDLPGRELMAPR